MKLPDLVLRDIKDPGLLDWIDYTRMIINNGRVQFRVVASEPDWTGSEGELVLYAAGNDRKVFTYINGAWNETSFSNASGQTIIDIGSGANLLGGNDTDGLWVGAAVFGDAPFRVAIDGTLVATSATLTGSITATSGAIGGWDIAATTLSSTNITIDSGNELLKSNDYVSGALGTLGKGWQIDASQAEFQNIRARGKITTSVFEKDTISVVGGNLLVMDGDILASDMTAAD